ncbi:MAG: PDZ domain-containing protein, partial [Candidatus Aminicenantales bacterium]
MSLRKRAFLSLTVFLWALPLVAGSGARAAAGEDITNVTKKVFPSVVKVEARNLARRVATGVVIDKDGYIVTTALISPRNDTISVITSKGKRVKAEFLGMDSETHLALIRAKDADVPPISIGKDSDLFPGSWIGVISLSPENTPQITQGIVSSLAEDRIRLNVWVGPGMSGSPVLDREGKMVGIVRGAYVDEQPIVFEFREKEFVGSGVAVSRAEAPASGMAVATPVSVVEHIVQEIRKKGKVERGWLGVRIGLDEEDRVVILEVEKESPAELAELKEGDVILEFEGKDVRNPESLAWMIRRRKPGETVRLRVEREGKARDIKVKLGEYTEEEAWSEFRMKFPRLFPPKPPEPPKALQPIEPIQPRLYQWGFEQRKYIGVYLQELNRELSEYFGVEKGLGLLVSRIEKDSPAEKAGLKVGDVIIRADGKRVERTRELSDLIQDKKKGETITIEYLRRKKTQQVEVEVEEEERGSLFQIPGLQLEISKEVWEKLEDQLRK